MKRLVFAATALLGACYEFTGPAPAPDLFLTGTWAYEVTNDPSGAYGDTITLLAVGGHITGTGREYRLSRLYSAFTISGWYSPTWFFNVTFTFPQGRTQLYVGQVYGVDSILGDFVDSFLAVGVPQTFLRQPVPPCASPATRLAAATFAPIAVVQFRNGVDAPSQAALLAVRYGFVVSSVYQSGSGGFSAPMSAATAAVLLCEPSVASIQYEWP